MIGYRFLPPAEEEMTEASHFYEAESSGLGVEFLDDVQHVMDVLREHPKFGQLVGRAETSVASKISVFGNLFGARGGDSGGCCCSPKTAPRLLAGAN